MPTVNTLAQPHERVKAAIRDDLAARPALTEPRLIGAVAEIVDFSAGLALVNQIIQENDRGRERSVAQYKLADILTCRICEIGVNHFTGTIAEKILRDAILARDSVLALVPAEGGLS